MLGDCTTSSCGCPTWTSRARHHGWHLLFTDPAPHAGAPAHYAAYLHNTQGF